MLLPHGADAAYKLDMDVVIPIRIGTSEWVVVLLCILITFWFSWTGIRRSIAECLFSLARWVTPNESAATPEVPWGERRFFVSPAGVCVHSNKDCRGLRTVPSGDKRSLRFCKVCCRECSSGGN